MGIRKKIGLTLLLIMVISYLFLQCTTSVSGVNVIGNPQKITACIKNASGLPVRGVAVSLVPADFNPLKKISDSGNDSIPKDTSDINGTIELFSKDSGFFNLISTSEAYQCSLYVSRIPVHDSSIDLETVTLKKPGTIVINIDSTQYRVDGLFVIPGTDIAYPVNKAGKIELQVPAGNISIRYVNNNGDSIPGGPVVTNIKIDENGTKDLTQDTIWVPVIYYDFHADGSNPEFYCDHMEGSIVNMVSQTLPEDGKPVLGSSPYLNNFMKYWFRDWKDSARGDFTRPNYIKVSGGSEDAAINYSGPVTVNHDTSFKNIVIHDSIPFINKNNGYFQYNNQMFYPLDRIGFGNESQDHNFSFTMEMAISFIKQPGKTISLEAGELWVYMNNKLEIDLGGIKTTQAKTLNIDNLMIQDGAQVTLKLFLAQRHRSQSAFSFTTNILN